MNEEDVLGKIAYMAYCKALGMIPRTWETEYPTYKQAWIAAAKAVAERVIAEMRTAEEASE